MVQNRFVVEVPDTQGLKQAVQRLRNIEGVFDAYRITPGAGLVPAAPPRRASVSHRAVTLERARPPSLALGRAAPSHDADALNAGGVPVAPGFLVVANSTFVTITGPYAQTIICTQSNLQYKVVLNNVMGVTVSGDLTNWTFGGCSLPAGPPTPCTVTVTLPVWPSPVEMNNRTRTVDISFVNGKVLTTTCAGVTCTYLGAGAVPPLSISGGWTDSPRGGGPARINFVNQR